MEMAQDSWVNPGNIDMLGDRAPGTWRGLWHGTRHIPTCATRRNTTAVKPPSAAMSQLPGSYARAACTGAADQARAVVSTTLDPPWAARRRGRTLSPTAAAWASCGGRRGRAGGCGRDTRRTTPSATPSVLGAGGVGASLCPARTVQPPVRGRTASATGTRPTPPSPVAVTAAAGGGCGGAPPTAPRRAPRLPTYQAHTKKGGGGQKPREQQYGKR